MGGSGQGLLGKGSPPPSIGKKRLIVGVVIGAIFMVLAFWGIPFDEFFVALGSLRLEYLLLFSLLYVLQTVLQAQRQRVLLALAVPEMSFRRSLSVIYLGFFCIQTLPARLGEFVRPILLKRDEGLDMGQGIGMVAVERALDMVALLLALTGVLLWVELPSHELVVAGMSIDILAWGWSTAQVLIPSITIAVVVLAVAGEPLVDLLEPLFLRVSRGLGLQRFAGRLVDFSRSFARSFRALRSPRRLGAALALSAAIWAEIALMFWVLAFGFELDHIIGFAQSAGVMTITALGALLPAPPAMAGVQEAFGRGALALFGAHGPELDATCLGYAVVAHWWQYLLNGLGALFFAAKEKVGLRELLAAPQQTLHDEASS